MNYKQIVVQKLFSPFFSCCSKIKYSQDKIDFKNNWKTILKQKRVLRTFQILLLAYACLGIKRFIIFCLKTEINSLCKAPTPLNPQRQWQGFCNSCLFCGGSLPQSFDTLFIPQTIFGILVKKNAINYQKLYLSLRQSYTSFPFGYFHQLSFFQSKFCYRISERHLLTQGQRKHVLCGFACVCH